MTATKAGINVNPRHGPTAPTDEGRKHPVHASTYIVAIVFFGEKIGTMRTYRTERYTSSRFLAKMAQKYV